MWISRILVPSTHYSTLQTSGFTDIAPVVREQTVKAVLTVIVKLNDRTINGELLKFLAGPPTMSSPGSGQTLQFVWGGSRKIWGKVYAEDVIIADQLDGC